MKQAFFIQETRSRHLCSKSETNLLLLHEDVVFTWRVPFFFAVVYVHGVFVDVGDVFALLNLCLTHCRNLILSFRWNRSLKTHCFHLIFLDLRLWSRLRSILGDFQAIYFVCGCFCAFYDYLSIYKFEIIVGYYP